MRSVRSMEPLFAGKIKSLASTGWAFLVDTAASLANAFRRSFGIFELEDF
jgi:hypothetical protein